MQISVDNKALHVDGLALPLSRHIVLALICRCVLRLKKLRGARPEAADG